MDIPETISKLTVQEYHNYHRCLMEGREEEADAILKRVIGDECFQVFESARNNFRDHLQSLV
jgi:hypothetical protein